MRLGLVCIIYLLNLVNTLLFDSLAPYPVGWILGGIIMLLLERGQDYSSKVIEMLVSEKKDYVNFFTSQCGLWQHLFSLGSELSSLGRCRWYRLFIRNKVLSSVHCNTHWCQAHDGYTWDEWRKVICTSARSSSQDVNAIASAPIALLRSVFTYVHCLILAQR